MGGIILVQAWQSSGNCRFHRGIQSEEADPCSGMEDGFKARMKFAVNTALSEILLRLNRESPRQLEQAAKILKWLNEVRIEFFASE